MITNQDEPNEPQPAAPAPAPDPAPDTIVVPEEMRLIFGSQPPPDGKPLDD